jgi:L-seryl-tRNA(Ser) seleniumtransferase
MDTSARLRLLPKVDELLKRDDVAALAASQPRSLVVDSLRDAIDATRARLLAGSAEEPSEDAIVAEASALLAARTARSLVRVINATGIIIHNHRSRHQKR